MNTPNATARRNITIGATTITATDTLVAVALHDLLLAAGGVFVLAAWIGLLAYLLRRETEYPTQHPYTYDPVKGTPR